MHPFARCERDFLFKKISCIGADFLFLFGFGKKNKLWGMSGPAIPLLRRHQVGMSNQRLPGKDAVKLIFAPVAAYIVFEKTTAKDIGDRLANEGYDPDEPRIPAGQPGGGQWTTESATGSKGLQSVGGSRRPADNI